MKNNEERLKRIAEINQQIADIDNDNDDDEFSDLVEKLRAERAAIYAEAVAAGTPLAPTPPAAPMPPKAPAPAKSAVNNKDGRAALLDAVRAGKKLNKAEVEHKPLTKDEELKLALKGNGDKPSTPSQVKKAVEARAEKPEAKIKRLLSEIILTEARIESLSKFSDQDLVKQAEEKAVVQAQKAEELKKQVQEVQKVYNAASKVLNSAFNILRTEFLGEGWGPDEEVTEVLLAEKPLHAKLYKDILAKKQDMHQMLGDLHTFVDSGRKSVVNIDNKSPINERAKLQREVADKKKAVEKTIRFINDMEEDVDVSVQYNEAYMAAKKNKGAIKKFASNKGDNKPSRLDTLLSEHQLHVLECARFNEEVRKLYPNEKLTAAAADLSNHEATIAMLRKELAELRSRLANAGQGASSSSSSTSNRNLQDQVADLEKSIMVFQQAGNQDAHQQLETLLPIFKESESLRLAALKLENDLRALYAENNNLLNNLREQRQAGEKVQFELNAANAQVARLRAGSDQLQAVAADRDAAQANVRDLMVRNATLQQQLVDANARAVLAQAARPAAAVARVVQAQPQQSHLMECTSILAGGLLYSCKDNLLSGINFNSSNALFYVSVGTLCLMSELALQVMEGSKIFKSLKNGNLDSFALSTTSAAVVTMCAKEIFTKLRPEVVIAVNVCALILGAMHGAYTSKDQNLAR